MSLPSQAVFLSYASQDAEAARRLVEALRAAGVEVWFDLNELVGGDAWDQKIHSQIKHSALFVPVISAATQARREGYFRLEWKLAAQRTHTMADGTPFLLPVVIDDTRDAEALVPPEFKAVQWTRLLSGEPTAAFIQRLKTILHPASAAPITAAVSVPSAPVSSVSPKPKSRIPWLVAAGLAAGVLALAAFLLNRPRPLALAPIRAASTPAPLSSSAPAPAPAAPALDPKAIAVLPFANLSSEKDSEYFSDGLSEEILDKLAKVRGLRVMARTSSFYYKGKNTPLKQIAQELQVGNVIEGSVRRAGNKLRITAQLIDTTTGENVWSETYDRELTDIFAVQTEIAQKITARLTSPENATTTASWASAPTVSLPAYELYLRARALQVQSVQGARQAVPLYQQAVALDPQFTLAWLRLGEAAARGIASDRGLVDVAGQAVARALILDPRHPLAYVVQARIAQQNALFAQASDALAKAEPLGPPTAELRSAQAIEARDAGDGSTYLRRVREAVLLDPQNGDLANSLGIANLNAGNLAEAVSMFRRATALAGPANDFVLPQSNLILNTLALRGPEAVLKLLQTEPNIGPVPRKAYTAWINLILGHETEAKALAKECLSFLQEKRIGVTNSERINIDLLPLVAEPKNLRSQAEWTRDYGRQQIARGATFSYPSRRPLFLAELLLGNDKEALQILQEWKAGAASYSALRKLDQYTRHAAECYARLGQADEAIAAIQESLQAGFHFGYSLQYLPGFAPIRNDPRFQALMKAEAAYAAAQPDPFAK